MLVVPSGCIQPDGKIVVAGYAGEGPQADFAMARHTVDGTLDTSFAGGSRVTVNFFGASDRAECIAIQADGKIVVAGSVYNVRTSGLGLIRMLP